MPHLRIKAQKEEFIDSSNSIQCLFGFAAFTDSWPSPVCGRPYEQRLSRESVIGRVPFLYCLVLYRGRSPFKPHATDSAKEVLGLLNNLIFSSLIERTSYELSQLQTRNK